MQPVDHWSLHAQNWARVGPPLRPCAEDIAIVEAEVARHAAGRAIRALILGVTPELIALRLPPGSTVVAVDREPAMVAALFAPAPGTTAVIGDWLALPVSDASCDVVAGDGGASMLAFPDQYRALAAELARVVRRGGIVVMRLFAAPEPPESLADVRAALATIGSFDALKWRIAMALPSSSRAVPVRAIRDAFDQLVPDRADLAARMGWRRDVIDHIDVYRDSPASYSFPTVAEVSAVVSAHLVEVGRHVPAYELGDRCPTLVWQRR